MEKAHCVGVTCSKKEALEGHSIFKGRFQVDTVLQPSICGAARP